MAQFPEAFLDELRTALPVLEVVSRRHKMRKEGNEYRAEDNHSLVVNVAKNIWKDFGSNGAGGDIFAFWMHETDCLFPEAVKTLASFAGIALPDEYGAAEPGAGRASGRGTGNGPIGPDPPPWGPSQGGGSSRRELVATYEYTDGAGSLLYEVCRLEWIEDGKRKKSFFQRRPRNDGGPGWICGLDAGEYVQAKNGDFWRATKERAGWKGARLHVDAVPHSLYRFADLYEELAQPLEERRIIFICEGEKDCDTLAAWGCIATTNSGGAKNWQRAHAEYFRGSRVVVLLDNDQAGRERGHMIAASLHGAKAASVKVLSWPDHWPGCPQKGDVTKWRDEAGGDVQRFFGIVEKLKDWEPPHPDSHHTQANPAADDHGPPDLGEPAAELPEGVLVNDFRAYMPMHSYIYMPARDMWPGASVNARVPPVPIFDAHGQPVLDKKGQQQETMAPAAWLDRNRPVEQMTWAPGEPMLIRNRLISDGGFIDHDGVTCFNLYRPPAIIPGDAAQAGPWLDHVRRVFGEEAAAHILPWLAHRVQRPHEKINHALVLGGAQGIGKDTFLAPIKLAVGPWNFADVTPMHIMGRFNGFVRSVVLRINEARDLGDVDRFRFYDHLKLYTAAPPDVLRVDEKNLREYAVLNCTGVIITTNHKSDGIYLPADDRRHFVAWSELTKEDFTPDYWKTLWGWYDRGGYRHVAAYLADISGFDPKAPPPKTAAFWAIVDASRAPEDAELADVLDRMGNPDATTLIRIANEATGTFKLWIEERKNRRAIPHRLEGAGYVPVRNDAAKDGLWKINDRRQAVYARSDLPVSDRLRAAQQLAQL